MEIIKEMKKYYANIWVLANPIIFYRMLKGFFRALVLRKNTLRVIELFPTFACQANCHFCSVDKYQADKKAVLTIDDYDRLARDGAKAGAAVVTILGGEPLMYPHLDELVAVFTKHHYYTHVVSNGLAVTTERLAELKKSGLKCIFFSIESLDPKVNDPIRGEGHVELTLRNLRWAQEIGLATGLGTVMMPGAMEHALGVIEYCEQNGLSASGGQIAPVGKAEDFSTLSSSEFEDVRQYLKKYPKLTFDWVFSYYLKQRCPAGKEKIGVTCFGDVVGCSYNPVSFGNYFEEPLGAILERMRSFSQFKKDFPGCLSSEDPEYIGNYLGPVCEATKHPVSYKDHPAITPENEPEVFGRR
ncbi:radical SAM protein [Pseudodesulfovibrio cashew]|uniref:Radical SAM protein n=1 Tax=Pseudodesulfovibrio cashew TaxID=2678688 RepID=A0A6I6JG35_9BACT|nr:radical SAM protein [Pseudodesulfovibrio cashew]QGY39362.1 radical SAM protein [Pseudodesulfovibrio cashew]